MLLLRKNEYKEKLAKYHGKEPRSIWILKNVKRPSKGWSTQILLHICMLRAYLALISMKELLCSCGTRERPIPGMTRELTTHSLALTSSRRGPIKKSTT
jgi:hypothetical protein